MRPRLKRLQRRKQPTTVQPEPGRTPTRRQKRVPTRMLRVHKPRWRKPRPRRPRRKPLARGRKPSKPKRKLWRSSKLWPRKPIRLARLPSNDTSDGRKQNRRVELVLSGDAIGDLTSAGASETASTRTQR